MPSFRKTAVLLTIGSELLKGSTLNTNARFLGERLLAAGFRLKEQIACDDVISEIKTCLARALKSADLVILTGGLGPTPDDVTREAVAAYFKKPLILSQVQWRRINRLYQSLDRTMPASVRQEALYPRSARQLINRYGIALGFCLTAGKKLVVVLPGVPRELENLMDTQVLPLLKRTFKGPAPKHKLILKTFGLSEPSVMEKLGADFFDEPFEFGIYPHPGEVTVRIFAESSAAITRLRRKALKRLESFIYSTRDESMAQALGECLRAKGHWLAAAESCTGGQLAAEMTRAPGASRYFRGGLTVYDNGLKNRLRVTAQMLRRNGAVSLPVAEQLARQIRKFAHADWGIGITGIAGPGGGSRRKPAGLVFIGVCGPAGFRHVERFQFWGTREQIQRRAVMKALELLWRALTR